MNNCDIPLPMGILRLAVIPVLTLLAAGGIVSAGVSAGEPIVIAQGEGADAPRQPQAVVGADGAIHIVFGTGDAVCYCRSDDHGQSYSKPAQVFHVPNMSLGMRRGPRIAVSEKAIVVTAVGGQMGKGRDGDVIAWRSVDRGSTWQGPVRVNDAADSAREGLHAMAASEDGTVWCTWLDLRDRKSEIYAAKSPDAGATWEPNICIYRSPGGSVCECCHPSIAVSGQNVHIMFRNSVDGDRDMYVTTSADGGQSFSAAVKMGHGSWSLKACPMDGGMLARATNGEVVTVWRRQGEVFYSALSGSSERILGTGQQPWVAFTGKGPVIAWTAARDGDLLIRIPGTTEGRKLGGVARDPVVAAALSGDGPVICCWESSRQGNSAVMAVSIETP